MHTLLPILLALFYFALTLSADPVANMEFIAFDLETTGFRPDHERIVEIGAVKFRGREVIASTNWLVNPGKTIPIFAARVHGISDAMVADAPEIADILPQFIQFIGNAPLVAHNAPFDTKFLAAEAARLGLPCPTNTVIDSLVLSRICYPLSPSYRLEDLTRRLRLGTTGHHRALADALYVYKLIDLTLDQLDADLTLTDLSNMARTPWESSDQ